MSWSAIWQWIDGDLNETRPLSLVLIIVPFVPLMIADYFTDDRSVLDAFLLGGMAVALPWFFYVIWRGLKVVARSFGTFKAAIEGDPPPLWRWAVAALVAGGLLWRLSARGGVGL